MAYEITKRVADLDFALVLDMERVMHVDIQGVSEPIWQMPLDNLPFFGDNETSAPESAPFGWDSVDGGVEDMPEAYEACENCKAASPDGMCMLRLCDCIPF